jgi:hypothetical protein
MLNVVIIFSSRPEMEKYEMLDGWQIYRLTLRIVPIKIDQ